MNPNNWISCKNPPKENGKYLLWFIRDHSIDNNYKTVTVDEDWCIANYQLEDDTWYDYREWIPYGKSEYGWSNLIPYKWKKVELRDYNDYKKSKENEYG